jgi:signal transduction histidine kinase
VTSALQARWRGTLPLVVAAVAVGLAGEWAFWRTGAPASALLADLAAGWAFVAAGLVAGRRQPANCSGRLMIAEGLSWFLTNLEGVGQPFVYGAGACLGGLNEAVLAHMILALPGGRLTSRVERATVTAAYVLALGLGSAYAVTGGPAYDPYRCAGCGTGIAVDPVARAALHQAERAGEIAAVLLAVVVVALVVRHWRRSSGPARRVLAPLWLSVGVSLLLLASHLADAFPGIPTPWMGPFVWFANAAQVAVPLGCLLVALRMRLARAAVGELVLELGSSLSADSLRAALPRALGDPSLELVLWHPASGAYRDRSGRPVTAPLGGGAGAVTRIDREGQPVALLLHDPALSGSTRLMETLAAAARLVADRERMREELRARMEAGDAERRRVERDLHDGAQQRFVSLALTLGSALRQIRLGPGGAAVEDTLTRAADELRLGLAELRELARGLAPAVLTERGLEAAVESLAIRAPVPVDALVEPGRWAPVLEATAYFVVSEALTNVARHAKASRSRVSIACRQGLLVVEIEDDGAGGADPGGGSGLRGLEGRVAAIGGTLAVHSPAGRGTRIRAELPCD